VGRWICYAVLTIVQMVLSAIVSRTVPMVTGAVGLFVLSWKFAVELVEATGISDWEYAPLLLLAIMALQGLAIILGAIFYAGKREKIEGTVKALLRTVPPAMPGIFFLSGETALDEDNEETATINLNSMNKQFAGKLPWHLSFSYGKALQKTCIVTWMGKDENKEAAQKALKARSNANSDAVRGTYVAGSCPSIGVDGNVKQADGPY